MRTMTAIATFIALAAGAASARAGQVPDLGREVPAPNDGWATLATATLPNGTIGGSQAAAGNVHVVHDRNELVAALAYPSATPKIVYIDGTANMASEQLDLTISPESKGMRLFTLRSPLYVRGPFIKPDAGVKGVPLMLRGTGMVALGVLAGPAAGLLALVAPSGGEPNQCAPLLEQMKAGKAPVTVKPTR